MSEFFPGQETADFHIRIDAFLETAKCLEYQPVPENHGGVALLDFENVDVLGWRLRRCKTPKGGGRQRRQTTAGPPDVTSSLYHVQQQPAEIRDVKCVDQKSFRLAVPDLNPGDGRFRVFFKNRGGDAGGQESNVQDIGVRVAAFFLHPYQEETGRQRPVVEGKHLLYGYRFDRTTLGAEPSLPTHICGQVFDKSLITCIL